MEVIFVFWIIIGIATAAVANRKGRSGCGWLILGLLLGPLTLLFAAVMRSEASSWDPPSAPLETKKCPFCAEDIKAEAILCRFCNREMPNT